jgi:hypothetical protein
MNGRLRHMPGLNFGSFENGFVAGDMDNTEKKAIEDGKGEG